MLYGPDIAPDGATPERADYGQVVIEQRLRNAMARLNQADIHNFLAAMAM